MTREEACLYAFNTLKATMVDYDQKITTNVNGVDVTISQGNAKPVTWTEGINEDGNIIGQIQNVSVDESVLDAGGNLSMDAFRPIAFEPAGSGYHVLGGKVGSAFQDGLRLK